MQDELCRTDGECCSGSCEANGTTADGRVIMRCANATSCLPAGEVCGGSGASSNCCPNGGGDTGCEPTGGGFRRCFGGENSTCTLPSHECTSTAECCLDPFPNVMCQPGRDGTNVCCLSQGEACAFGDVCCCGVCAPDAAGALVCCPPPPCLPDGATCTMPSDCCAGTCGVDPANPAGGMVCNPGTCTVDGADCTTSADCCSGACGLDAILMRMVCSPTTCVGTGGGCTVDGDCCGTNCCRANAAGVRQCTSDCGTACTLGQLGDFCAADSECCNSPPVICDPSVEFRRCILP